MNSVRLLLNPVWPWTWIALTGLAMFGLVLWTYPPRIRHLPPFRRRVMLALRLLAGAIVLFAMLRPTLQFTKKDEDPAEVYVLADASRSMATPDGPAGVTRRAELVNLFKEHEQNWEELGKRVQFRFKDFDTEIVDVAAPTEVAEGRLTSIGKVLDTLRREESGRRLGGVIMMSDFAQRAMGEDDVDPRSAARRFVEQRGVPIHPVVFGS